MTALEFPPLAPPEILAAEEVLLEATEAGTLGETLAFWESTRHFIVLGYGNKVATEVNRAACERFKIPILRRISGGGTVLQGPGVLNYSLVLRATEGTPLDSINGANQFIMQRNADAITKLLNASPASSPGFSRSGEDPLSATRPAKAGTTSLVVEVQGHTDLAIAGRKFSGNAQRRKRTHLLFHGAILLDLDLDLLDAVLPMPSLQPDYRAGRSHREFLTQLPVAAASVKQALRNAWSAGEPAELESGCPGWREAARLLVAEKYSDVRWNLRA